MAAQQQIDVMGRSVEKANIWLRDMARELGSADRSQAYREMRAVLHALRDRLTTDESAQLAAQLPQLIRGIYYEGWRPSGTPQHYREAREFLDRVRDEAGLAGETEASFAVAATSRVLHAHVSEGELNHVIAMLPDPLRTLFTQNRQASRGGRR